MPFTLGGRLRLEGELVDGRLITRAFLDDRELPIGPELVDALATLVTGRPPEARVVRELVRLGVLAEIAPPGPLPAGRIALKSTTGIEARFRPGPGDVRPLASIPISGFIPAETLGRLQALAAHLESAWNRLVSAAHSRGRLVDPDDATRIFEALVRERLERDYPLAELLRFVSPPRLEPVAPLQTPGLQYPITELRFHADRLPGQSARPPYRLRLVDDSLAEIGQLLGRLARGVEEIGGLSPRLQQIVATLLATGMASVAEPPPLLTVPTGAVMHLGHATLLANLDGRHLLVDPWLPPASKRDAVSPVSPSALPDLTGIFITHHHWDHVDVESLLRLPKDVPIHLPRQDHTRALSPRTDRLLEDLGFTRIVLVSPGDVIPIGERGNVTVLPFVGEDPTRIGWAGACYVLSDPSGSALVNVDSGVSDVDLARFGPLLVFATRRQERGTMVEHTWEFLLRPISEWARPTENCCNDASDLARLCRAASATRLVLYSEGGADWYPLGTDFLRGAAPSASMLPHEYLWDDLEAIRGAVATDVVLSSPFDVYPLGGTIR